jgi:hypothetical protein
MKLKIKYSSTTGKIKEAFSKMFPFLKIEFFKKPHKVGEVSEKKLVVTRNTVLGDITGAMKEGDIMISPETRTSDLEQLFQQKFGLSIQVFRNQNNTWIETSNTDDLSLADQNEKGRLASAQPERVVRDRYLEDGQY